VAVLRGGQVVAFDRVMRVRWQTTLALAPGEIVTDAAVVVTPVSIYTDDRGAVLVSVSSARPHSCAAS
jgi:hypothetical protein